MIDIGGTKIHAWVAGNTSIPPVILKTKRGIPALTQSLRHLLNHYNNTPISHVHIAIPGKLIGPNKATVATGTAQQLGTYSGEMDNFNVQSWAETQMQQENPSFSHSPITIENDAIFQMKWRLTDHGLEKLSGRTILYIGPGTGLGGGLCKIEAGQIKVYGDGHIYDILLKYSLTGVTQIAEDIISGSAVKTLTGHTSQEIALDNTLWKKHTPELSAISDAFQDLVKKLKSGKFQKQKKENQWPQEVLKIAMTIDTLILGGSLGTKPPFAQLFEHPLRLNQL